MSSPDDRLTVSEIAILLGIKPETWRAYVSRGQRPAADGMLDGRTPFWHRSTVESTRKPREKDS